MATRPDLTAKPITWADGGGADVIDPGIARQGTGWVDFEPLNNGHINEMMRRYGQFMTYLDNENDDLQNYIKGIGSEGLCVADAGSLTVNIVVFNAVVNSTEFNFPANPAPTITPDPVNPTKQIIYIDPAGLLQIDTGVFIGGRAHEASPLPVGALLCRIDVPAAAPNLAGAVVFDYRKRSSLSPFMYLHEAFARTADHEISEVWFKDIHLTDPGGLLDTASFTFAGSGTGSGEQKNTLATTGDAVIMAGDGAVDPRLTDRDLRALGTTYSYTEVNTTGTKKIVSDGITVACIHDDFVEVFRLDGAFQWSFDHGADVRDVVMTQSFVYICGVDSTGVSVRKLARSNGASILTYDHGATVGAIWADDKVLHLMGNISSHGSASTFRIITATLFEDVTGEGGNGADGTGEALDAAEAALVLNNYKFIESPDGVLYRQFRVSAGRNFIQEWFKRRQGAATSTIASLTGRQLIDLGAGSFNVATVDQDYIFTTEDTDRIVCIDRITMTILWRKDVGTGQIYGLASDGQRLYMDFGTPPNTAVTIRGRGNRGPSKFIKITNRIATGEISRTSMVPIKR